MNNLNVTTSYVPGCPGILSASGTLPDYPMPIVTVFYRFRDQNTVIEILSAYVYGSVRKQGVYKAVLKNIGVSNPAVKSFYTDEATIPGWRKLRAGWTRKNKFKSEAGK